MGSTEAPKWKRGNLPWFLALCLLGLAVLFRLAGQTAADPLPNVVAEVADSQPGSLEAKRRIRLRRASLQAHGLAATGNIGADGYLLPGDNYAAIERRLAGRVAYDDRALFVMNRAAMVCSSPLDARWREKAIDKKARAYAAWKESFCNGRTSGGDAKTYMTMTHDSMRRLTADWGERDVGKGSRLYFEAALDSDSLNVTEAAATMLTVPDLDTWSVGLEEVEGTAYLSKLPRYQQVALQGIECTEAGGCGPSGLMSVWLCVMTPGPDCSPGSGIEESWSDEFAPNELAIIARIQQRILEERARRAEAQAEAGSL